jgi:signal transduction histidine kinase/CheY-like chemotaxis protein
MDADDTLIHVAALGPPEQRRDAAERLAVHLGADAVFMFVPHPDVRTKLVPAPGAVLTLPSGRGWRDLLALALAPGIHQGVVAFPTADRDAAATAFAFPDLTVVVVGSITASEVFQRSLQLLAPTLGATLRAEQQVLAIRGDLDVAHEATARASALARALDAARHQAERATRVKSEFLAMLGHELRNPLAPIVTGLQMLRLDGTSSRVLDVIDRQVAHLSRLVDDLLDVSRITQGKVELRREIIEVHSVITRAIEMARPMLDERHSSLQVQVPEQGLTVHGDPARLAQVFSNLVTNAAKYSDANARIEITAACQDGIVRIAVTDNGIGIGADYIDHVFEQFVQVPQGIDRAVGGLGLGLTIVRSLVTQHGGHVTVTSPGTGKGSTFVVELPFARGQVSASPTAVPAAPSSTNARASVLIVDDNTDAADLLGELLTTFGYSPRIAHSAPEALVMLETFKPTTALLDIGLPVMDGYELAALMRQRVPGTKLVAVTGYGQAGDRERTRVAGFDAHLVKPVSIDTVIKTLEQLLSRTREHAE